MAKFNSIDVVPRVNRPSSEDKTKLDLHYIANGSYTDPYRVSSVTIFKDTTGSSTQFPYISRGLPDPFLDLVASSSNYGLLNSSADSYMVFHFKNTPVSALRDPSAYDGTTLTASSIYRSVSGSTGKFSVILTPATSSLNLAGSLITIPASGLQAGNYFDIWTIQHTATGQVKTFIQTFTLQFHNVIVLNEPVNLTITTRFSPEKIHYGEKILLHFLNDIHIDNRNIVEAIKNSFRDSVIQSASIKLQKYNEEPHLSARYTVLDWADTSGSVTINGTDDVSYLFDTTTLQTLANNSSNLFGSVYGLYEVQLKFTILDSIYFSPRFYIKIQP
jgi:hypothetical protein